MGLLILEMENCYTAPNSLTTFVYEGVHPQTSRKHQDVYCLRISYFVLTKAEEKVGKICGPKNIKLRMNE